MIDVNELKTELVKTAKMLRLGKHLEAIERIGEHSLSLEGVLPMFSQEDLPQVHRVSMAMFTAQQNLDWLGLADDLEYDFIALLNRLDT